MGDLAERKDIADESFRSLVESLRDVGLLILDAGGNVVSWHAAAGRVQTGNGDAKLRGHWSRYFTEEDVAKGAPERALRIAREVGQFEQEVIQEQADHSRRHALVRINGLVNESGMHIGYGVATCDITHFKRSAEAQKEGEQRLRMTLEAAKMGAWDWDIPTNRSYWNAQLFELLGLAPDDRGGDLDLFMRAVHPGDVEKIRGELASLLESKGDAEIQHEFRILRPDGQSRWLFARGKSSRDQPTGAPRRMFGVMFDITERKRAEEQLKMLNTALESAANGIVITTVNGEIEWVNPAFTRMTGYGADECLGKNPRLLKSGKQEEPFYREMWQRILAGEVWHGEVQNRRKDGQHYWEEMTITPVRDERGRIQRFIAVKQDISKQRRLEAQLHQSQKLEAVGQLAGGVAHDFNNLLTVISGYSEIVLSILPPNDPSREALKAIQDAGQRAAGLTRQLLAFSRQAVLEPRVLNLNETVQETEKMLRRLIGEDISLSVILDPHLQETKVDPGLMGQILMNLAVNARDAMPRGGMLTIETRNVEESPGDAAAQSQDARIHWVQLSVSDNGCGMTPDVKNHIFEPFFTTKGVGKGTGLGLAVVHGIVHQSGGRVEVYSEESVGTTFKLYFPAAESASVDALKPFSGDSSKSVGRGSESILLVEDEAGVRGIAMLALQQFGYHVLPATDGADALRILDNHKGPLHLLVTDLVMPGMSGRELSEILTEKLPKLKTLYMSGYTDDAVIRHGLLHAQVVFLQKPFSPIALARKVRGLLDA